MPSRSRLGELVDEITVGYVGPMIDEYVDTGVPFLRSLNVKPHRFDSTDLRFISPEFHAKIRKSALSPGDVVAVRTGIPGTSCVIPSGLETANCSDLVIFRCGEEVDPHYLSYYLNLIASSHLRHQSVGAVQKHFNIGSAKDLLLPDVGIEVQRKIAAVLTALDAKIDLNNRINAELEALAKTIYDYWFVQFDFPDAKGRPYKSSGGKMVWNEALKREIPAGWEGDDISAVAEILGGATPSKARSDYWDGDIPFFTPTDAATSVFQLQTEDSITRAGLESCSSDYFAKGTVFITARGSVGKIAIAGRSMAMNQSCYALVPKVSTNFPYVFLHAKTLIHHLKVKASGSTFNSIVTNDIEWTRLISPKPEVISEFCKVVTPMFERIESAQRENHELTQLRDWLLPLLMNGQVRVA